MQCSDFNWYLMLIRWFKQNISFASFIYIIQFIRNKTKQSLFKYMYKQRQLKYSQILFDLLIDFLAKLNKCVWETEYQWNLSATQCSLGNKVVTLTPPSSGF